MKAFLIVINNLVGDLNNSYLFDRGCDTERAFRLMDDFINKFEAVQNQSEDLKQLQELLETNVVDFNMIAKSRTTLVYLKQTWRVIR